ncbi:MAG: GNAT family N-acetyltransferase [Balneolaceae bacterium]|nr:MAG: GNAT family N-acetyltransferase [Balneolaceae bacterium]
MIEPAGWDDWHDIYQKAPLAAFFQSPDWSGIWERYTDGKFQPSPLLTTLPSGRQVLVPATRQRLPFGLGHTWHMAPAGTYGGWLPVPDGDSNASPLSSEDARVLLQELRRYCGSMTFRWYPLITDTAVPDLSGQGIEIQSDRSYLLDTSVGAEALHSLLYKTDGNMRREIAKARRSGIRVRRADSRSDWTAYHKLYLQGIGRWSNPPQHTYRQTFFDQLADMPDKCELWLAELDNLPVAGAVLVYGKDHVAYWHGAFDYEQRALRPVNLLLATIIESVPKQGYRWFDFNPSMGLRGVEHFKSRFGGRPYNCPVIRRTSVVLKILNTAGRWLNRAGMRRRLQ